MRLDRLLIAPLLGLGAAALLWFPSGSPPNALGFAAPSLPALPTLPKAPESGVPLEVIHSIMSGVASVEKRAHTKSREFRAAQRRVHYATFSAGLPDQRLVTLTFDDGPDPTWTPRILDILKREGVPATFFVIGKKAVRHRDLIRRAAAEGHDIGNHTYHHFEFDNLEPAAVRFEIERTNEILTDILGGPTRWFRAPGCHYTPESLHILRGLNLVRVDTSNNTADWTEPGSGSIVDRALNRLASGDVILCHDRIPATVNALPRLIRAVRRRGYRFVSLAELAQRAQKNPHFRPIEWPRRSGVALVRSRVRVVARKPGKPARAG